MSVDFVSITDVGPGGSGAPSASVLGTVVVRIAVSTPVAPGAADEGGGSPMDGEIVGASTVGEASRPGLTLGEVVCAAACPLSMVALDGGTCSDKDPASEACVGPARVAVNAPFPSLITAEVGGGRSLA